MGPAEQSWAADELDDAVHTAATSLQGGGTPIEPDVTKALTVSNRGTAVGVASHAC